MEACDWDFLKGSLLSLYLPSFIYFIFLFCPMSSLSVGIWGGGTTLPFVRGLVEK